jgi:hypothetical protein
MPNRHRQLDIYDGLADTLLNEFIDGLQRDGLDDEQIKMACARLHYRTFAKQFRQWPKRIRDRWLLWFVEEFAGDE